MTSEYVRVSNPERIYGEKNLVQAQIELLRSARSFNFYKKLRQEEISLKISLKEAVEKTKKLIEGLEHSLPKTEHKTPREVEKKEEIKRENSSIYDEIETLSEKLAQLQSEM